MTGRTAAATAADIAAPRTWSYFRRGDRATVAVTCPTWCRAGHEMDQYLTTDPADITHQACGREASVQANAHGVYEDWRILSAHLDSVPDAQEPERRWPHVTVELVDDVWSPPMDPDQLGEFIDVVAGQVAELRRMHAELLAARSLKVVGGAR
ncbi:hypothetical protein [Streptomyces sp. Amel2xC10]|uniref:DUF6907 domain-containing protein n=1 Tax=Streptomyces sp. Amel2xC10 TaxID=1305826 RepID=UPI000A08D0A6|nr:hypothetical protein [Streptomyces sp. Amel2xC10]SMF64664.1 hypothetical protein SAMN02745830_05033 [Streptomyces sp. Amel2xC10]